METEIQKTRTSNFQDESMRTNSTMLGKYVNNSVEEICKISWENVSEKNDTFVVIQL